MCDNYAGTEGIEGGTINFVERAWRKTEVISDNLLFPKIQFYHRIVCFGLFLSQCLIRT